MVNVLERMTNALSRKETTTDAQTVEGKEIVSRASVEKRVHEKFGEERIVSARELWQSNLIDWIGSYKALLKYVSTDYRKIFNPKTTGKNSGMRYYVPVDNIVEFLYKFENNKL